MQNEDISKREEKMRSLPLSEKINEIKKADLVFILRCQIINGVLVRSYFQKGKSLDVCKLVTSFLTENLNVAEQVVDIPSRVRLSSLERTEEEVSSHINSLGDDIMEAIKECREKENPEEDKSAVEHILAFGGTITDIGVEVGVVGSAATSVVMRLMFLMALENSQFAETFSLAIDNLLLKERITIEKEMDPLDRLKQMMDKLSKDEHLED